MTTKLNNEEKSVFKNPWFYLVVFGVIAILLISFRPLMTGNDIKDNSYVPSNSNSLEDDDAILGDPNAPITIIEFSDYECPYCARFVVSTLPALKSKYIDTGKVKLVYRDFPLGFHKNAQKAAEATEVARELGGDDAFWEMHDVIFETGLLTVKDLKQHARDIGLDGNSFDKILDSDKYALEVLNDLKDGQALGITGTPSFFIEGDILVGAQPFEVFEQAIEAKLNG